MRTGLSYTACVIVAVSSFLVTSYAFAPNTNVVGRKFAKPADLRLKMGLLDGSDQQTPLTRENEPEEFFATNTDKMTDQEKIPIALAGLAGISLPFILGLIALYAAK